jgi:hypothetical protein
MQIGKNFGIFTLTLPDRFCSLHRCPCAAAIRAEV